MRIDAILDGLQREITYAVRTLRRSRGFAIAAMLTLALGIGANTAIFSVMYGVLWKPLPFPESSRLVRIDEITPASARPDGRERRSGAVTVAELLELRARARTIAGASVTGGLTLETFSGHGEAARLQGYLMGPGLFDTLGVTPLLGRGFGKDEEVPGADRRIVLSYAAWQRHFGGDPAVIGRTFVLANALQNNAESHQYSVVGVMPEGFVFPDRQFEFWLPVAWTPSSRGGLIARLAPGSSIAAAEAEIGGILRDLRKPAAGVSYTMAPLSQQSSIDEVKPALRLLAGAAAFVLLIACANVANLLVARSMARQREMAVRLALGASRGRLLLHALTETTLLALCGGAVGMLLAAGGVRVLKTLATTLGRLDLGVQLSFPRLDEIAIDPAVVVFVLLMSTVTGVLLGLVPAIRYTRPARMAALRQTAGGHSDSGGLRRAGNVVVAVEIALALVLLVGCGLLVRSFANLLRIDPGYNHANVLTFQVALPSDRYRIAAVKTFAEGLTARIQSIPGVEAAAHGQPPLVAITESALFRRTPEIAKPPRHDVSRRLVSSDYLKVMGIKVVAGRGLTDRDRAGQPRVLLINETLARRDFPGENPIGQQVYAGADAQPWEIVGVVADVRQTSLDREAGMQVFAEYSQWPGEVIFPLGPYFSVRTRSHPMATIAQVRESARQLEPEAGLFNVATMEQVVSNRLSRPRLYTTLLGIFAMIAVALAAVGVYGVMAYSVTRRTREIGIRIALGAQRREVIALVMRQGLVWNGIGLAAGLAGAMALTKYLESLLFGVTPLDPRTFVAVSLVLFAVATLATLLPARVATRVSPLGALRAE
jgi:putative ABC transport system permease protein